MINTTTESAAVVAAEQGGRGGSITPLILLVALVAFTYLILIRPQRNRMRQLQATQATLTPGAEVMTTAGLYATVVEVDEDTVTLEVAPGVHNRYDRRAVARVLTPADSPTTDEPTTGEDASTPDE